LRQQRAYCIRIGRLTLAKTAISNVTLSTNCQSWTMIAQHVVLVVALAMAFRITFVATASVPFDLCRCYISFLERERSTGLSSRLVLRIWVYYRDEPGASWILRDSGTTTRRQHESGGPSCHELCCQTDQLHPSDDLAAGQSMQGYECVATDDRGLVPNVHVGFSCIFYMLSHRAPSAAVEWFRPRIDHLGSKLATC